MLTITIGADEYFDPVQGIFVTPPKRTVRLEHSLRSVAKWESKWEVPFLSDKPKTREQTVDYIRCMDLNSNDESVFQYITDAQIQKVNEYISANMTATTITRRGPKKTSREIVTSEIIYFWMIQLGIPPEYDKWHLNRLLMLVEVCSEKTGPQKKMSRKEQMAQQRALNASRLAKYKTRG